MIPLTLPFPNKMVYLGSFSGQPTSYLLPLLDQLGWNVLHEHVRKIRNEE